MNDFEKRLRAFAVENVGFLTTLIVCAVFILSAMIIPHPGKKSIDQIILDGAMTFILGIAINRMLSIQGKMNGRRSEAFQSTLKLHGDTVTRITPILGKLNEYCATVSAENMKIARARILAGAGLRYEDWFGDNPQEAIQYPVKEGKGKAARKTFKEKKRSYKIKKKAIGRARKLNLTDISAAALTSEGVKVSDPLNLGRTYAEYEVGDIISDVASKAALALVFGYFGVDLLQDMSLARVIWYALEAVVLFAFGIIRMNKTYSFITEDYRQRIIRKVDQLNKFENWAKEQEVKQDG